MIIEEMTMGEFQKGLDLTRTVFIPFGSVEEHGYHLPLSTDTIQAYEVGKDASRVVPLFVAPPVHYGCCRSTSCHPGTISITTGTLKAILLDLIRSFYSNGLKNFIILTGHAGGTHRMALQDAGEELLNEILDIKIAVVTEFDLARKLGRGIIETEGDCHAGEIETSRVMHARPDLVKGTGKKEYPRFPEFILVRKKRIFWEHGVWGDPEKATTEKGKKLHELVVARVVELVNYLNSFSE